MKQRRNYRSLSRDAGQAANLIALVAVNAPPQPSTGAFAAATTTISTADNENDKKRDAKNTNMHHQKHASGSSLKHIAKSGMLLAAAGSIFL